MGGCDFFPADGRLSGCRGRGDVGGRLPDLSDAGSWTPGPDLPTAAASLPGSPSTASFVLGEPVRNANAGPVNLRRSAGFRSKPANDVLAVASAGQVGEIAGGPQEADGLTWWLVRFNGQEGWMAERSSQGVILLERAP
ncbi:MAG: hypothetical protein V9H69_19930 [Anaerolineae bacterium]